MLVGACRWWLGSAAGVDFVEKYPGAAPMPESAPVGIPAWLAWQHFLNAFFMVFIVRTGWIVRHQRRPEAYWAPKNKPKAKISIQLWLHLCLDLLWVANGLLFIILLFATGQWMRIVPSSLDVFPQALSALVQIASLNWPVENGWVHYNAIQQLTYFVTVFIAAPLAIISGVRMSPWWNPTWRISTLVPLATARKIHVPVMVYFVGFVIVHVGMVAATGLRRNLNHIFLARGSQDPAVYAENWGGVLVFLGAVMLGVIGWFLIRPVILLPLAKATGTVSSR